MVVAAAGPRMGYEMDLTSTITLSTLNLDTRKNTIILFASDILINTAEIDRLVSLHLFDELIIHELGHALGIGSRYWRLNDLNDGRSDEYVGLAGLAAWRFLGCSGNLPAWPGHWHPCLIKELMSGLFVPLDGFHQLSIMTIGALMDLGYVVNFGAADDFGLDDLNVYCGLYCPEYFNRRKLHPENVFYEDPCENLSADDREIVMQLAMEMLSKARAEAPPNLPPGQVLLAGEELNMILRVGEGICGLQVTWAEVQKWQYQSTN
jgi:hypothetical protein